jgi:hypothetical protein
MYAQGTAAAFGQHLEVSTSLRGFDHPECVFLSWHGEIGGIVARDLQEYS